MNLKKLLNLPGGGLDNALYFTNGILHGINYRLCRYSSSCNGRDLFVVFHLRHNQLVIGLMLKLFLEPRQWLFLFF